MSKNIKTPPREQQFLGRPAYRKLKNKKTLTDSVKCQLCGKWYKNIGGPHLRVHGMTAKAYKEKFPNAITICEETRFRIALANGRLDDNTIIKMIQERHQAGKKMNAKSLDEDDYPLYDNGTRYFGSWSNALKAAGLDPAGIVLTDPKRRWTKESVVTEILARKKLAQPLNYASVLNDDLSLWAAANTHFGNWSKALAAAGLDPSSIKLTRRWTKEDLLAAIRQWEVEGQDLFFRAACSININVAHAAIQHFGSWDNVLRELGLDPEKVRQYRKPWTKDEVLEAIQNARLRESHLTPPASHPGRLLGQRGDSLALGIRR